MINRWKDKKTNKNNNKEKLLEIIGSCQKFL